MNSVQVRRAWRELSRHRARATLTIATLAGAVLGVWLFAIPRQMDRLMADEVERASIHDVRLFPDGIRADADTLDELRSIDGVAALDVKATYFTELQIGERLQDVYLVGIYDFADQHVNVIDVRSGAAPTADHVTPEAIADPQNARTGRSTAGIGDEVLVRSGRGGFEPVTLNAIGGSIHYSHGAVEGAPVLYVPIETLWELWPWPDVATLVEFRVADRSDAATSATIDAVRQALHEIKPAVTYNALVDVRPPGAWPGEEDFDNFQALLWTIVAISLLSSLVLVATTATALVREQIREIGIMKAIGGTRRQILGSFVITLGLLGAAGTVVGTLVGYPATNLLMDVMNRDFVGIDNDWRFSWFAFGLSFVVGVAGTLLAAVPALMRVARTPVRAALDSAGLGGEFGRSGADRLLRRLGFVSGHARLGIRNTLRSKARTTATTVQVALAVGTLLGFTALMITMIEIGEQARLAEGGDIEVYSSGSGRPIDVGAIELAATVDGVAKVQPTVWAELLVGDTETFALGLPADPVYRYELDSGRWFTDQEERDGALVAIAGPALTQVHDLELGDPLTVQTRDRSMTLDVIGIDTTMVGDGLAVYAPLSTMLQATGRNEPSLMWLTTTSSEQAEIDAVGAEIRRQLEGRGYGFGLDLRYVEREADRATDRSIVAVIMSMGLPVVAIGMIGLAGAITTSALERRREIGVLRSIGAGRRDIRRIFRAEAVTIVLAGWLVGIALGYVIGRIILLAMNEAFDVEFTLLYPWWPIPVSLVIALLVAAVVLARPIGHASRLSPSISLRYE